MDPYLENPAVFPDLHDAMVFALREALNARLPSPYFASGASRVWMETSSRRVEPDVNVLWTKGNGNGGPAASLGATETTATKTKAQPIIVHLVREERREAYLEIFTDPGGERLVTSVELLSLSNKTPEEQGRELYERKQTELLNSQVNLVEIDLLRGGLHTTAVPRSAALKLAGPFDYHVCIREFETPDDYGIYAFRLSDPLPSIEVPLLPGDQPIEIELQPLLDRCYDTGHYDRRVRYREWAVTPPLLPEQSEWAEGIVKGALSLN
jgi:hypothetical protein